MVEKKTATAALIKALNGTLNAADLTPVADATGETQAAFDGERGALRIEFDGDVLRLYAQKGDSAEKQIEQTLFEPEQETWTEKDTLSTATDLADSIASFFGTEVVPVGQNEKKPTAGGKKAEAKASAPAPKKKKKEKKEAQAYDALHLAYRMEVIFPELSGKVQENEEEYGTFLPEEYFETQANPFIVDAIRSKDRQVLKKLFKTFNTYYEEGEKDTQSLVAVTILGMNMAKEDAVAEEAEKWLADDLGAAETQIVSFLKSAGGQRALKKYESPKPYKETKFHKMKKTVSKVFKEKVGDPSQMMLDAQSMQNMNR